MKKILVKGGNKLTGTVAISGAKNSSLPILAASLLCAEGVSEIQNVPDLLDVTCMIELLQNLGAFISVDGTESIEHGSKNRKISINSQSLTNDTAPYELVNKMRASILVLAPLLCRMHHAKVALPGGCAIGMRPVDLHLKVLEAMGAKLEIKEGYVVAQLPNKRFKAANFTFEKVSVGATETAIMAASLADGVSTFSHSAEEPEIIDLCNYLTSCGAKIEGIGSSTLKITGVKQLKGVDHDVIADRIEAGTYAIAAAITGGKVTLTGADPQYLTNVLEFLNGMGVSIIVDEKSTIEINAPAPLKSSNFETAPYPLFPTDLQAQALTLNTLATGQAIVEEKIFENRFMHVPELVRMGASIKLINNQTAQVHGVKHLTGAEVKATDLRASAALILAGFAAKGKTVISEVEYIFRGYSNVIAKFQAIGGDINVVEAN